ncbi:MAG: hypothetical protein EOO10_07545, partial [Chitinophagaceae bacterium]
MESINASNTAPVKYRSSTIAETLDTLKLLFAQLYVQVKFLGHSHTMDDYEQRKLRIFNQINFFQLLAGLFIPLLGMALPGQIPTVAWMIACWPAIVSFVALALNYFRQHDASLYAYFLGYPLFTCFVYLNGMNPGIELHFILFVVLSVFFLKDFGFMLFAIGFSMISFFILSVVLDHFTYEVEKENKVVYLLYKAVSLVFIFYGLFLVKKENTVYQFNILAKQKNLADQNAKIETQHEEISAKAVQLEKQKEELAELNAFKNKLFSIISHDLKSPMYALRNLFQNMHHYNLPADEIKEMVPDVLKDLKGLEGITTTSGTIDIMINSSLTSLEGLDNFKSLQSGTMTINDCDKLTTLHGLESLESVSTQFVITENDLLNDISALNSFTTSKALHFVRNANLTNITGLESV